MSSEEASRTTIYGKDLAIRVVWHRLRMELMFREIAKCLQIGIVTAYRLYNQYVVTGEFSPLDCSRSRPEGRKLDELHEFYVIGLLVENPGLYLSEMCHKID